MVQVTQLSPLAFLPAFLLRRKVLRPMKVMAGGTMLVSHLAPSQLQPPIQLPARACHSQ